MTYYDSEIEDDDWLESDMEDPFEDEDPLEMYEDEFNGLTLFTEREWNEPG
jgi:hypothetical protein